LNDLSSFSRIFWIDATSQQTIEGSFIAISSHKDARERGVEATVASVLEWLTSLSDEWLLVFDGADHEPHFVSTYLPGMNRGNILISTRNPEMSSIVLQMYEIIDMRPSEAVTLLLVSAGHDPASRRSIDMAIPIVKELCFMPLAVDQAGSAIKSHLATLGDYLNLYKKHRKRLLDDPSFEGQSKYERALYTTWDISFNAIIGRAADRQSSRRRASAVAIFLLRVFSFLHYEGISEELFSRAAVSDGGPSGIDKEGSKFLHHILSVDSSFQWDSLKFREGLRVLLSFSLVKPAANECVYTMHRLVHTWVRDRMDNTEHLAAARVIDTLFYRSIPGRLSIKDNIPFLRAILSHIMASESFIKDCLPKRKDANAFLLSKLGMVFEILGHSQEALLYYKRALRLRQQTLGPDSAEILSSMSDMATVCRNTGDHKQAEKLEIEVLAGRKRRLGSKHELTLTTMNNLAVTYLNQGKYSKARSLLLQVFQERKRTLGLDHRDTLSVMNNLATMYRDLGDHKKAGDLEEQVHRARERDLGPEHLDTLQGMHNLASAYSDIGKYDKAEELAIRVVDGRTQVLGVDDSRTLLAMKNLARIYCQNKKYHQSEELILEVLEKQKKLLGASHADIGDTEKDLAVVRRWIESSSTVTRKPAANVRVANRGGGQVGPSAKALAAGIVQSAKNSGIMGGVLKVKSAIKRRTR
jgi:tetratricopeptide (TPR) repeat protein